MIEVWADKELLGTVDDTGIHGERAQDCVGPLTKLLPPAELQRYLLKHSGTRVQYLEKRMSVNVEFSDGGPFTLATTEEWVAFCDWAERLPPEFPATRGLAANGACGDSAALSKELSVLSYAHGGPPPGVDRAFAELRVYVGVGEKGEEVKIS